MNSISTRWTDSNKKDKRKNGLTRDKHERMRSQRETLQPDETV